MKQGILSSCGFLLFLILSNEVPATWHSREMLQSVKPRPKPGPIVGRPSERQRMEFTTGHSGEMETKDGLRLGFTDYKGPDGVGLRVLYWDFDEPFDASRAFEKEIARAQKVVERGKKIDQTGKVVGERAQVVFRSTTSRETFPVVLWIDGRRFHEIQSRSLRHILEFEKIYKY